MSVFSPLSGSWDCNLKRKLPTKEDPHKIKKKREKKKRHTFPTDAQIAM
jgi:hypothetical protein